MLAKTITEVRQEAVQQALAALKNRPKPSLPMPSKRSSVFNRSPERGDDHSGNFLFSLNIDLKMILAITLNLFSSRFNFR
jgi:hypothetical protein